MTQHVVQMVDICTAPKLDIFLRGYSLSHFHILFILSVASLLFHSFLTG